MSVQDILGAESVAQVAMIGVFHIAGGVVLGLTLRSVADAFSVRNLLTRFPFLIWGSMFGLIPLLFTPDNSGILRAGQITLLVAAIAVAFFWRDRLREMAADPHIVMTAAGGLFLAIGLSIGGVMLGEGEWLFGLGFGSIFALVGSVLLVIGLRNLFRD